MWKLKISKQNDFNIDSKLNFDRHVHLKIDRHTEGESNIRISAVNYLAGK